MEIDIPAFHSMEYIYGFIVNDIIQNLKWIAAAIKANKQILVIMRRLSLIEPTVILALFNSAATFVR